MKTSAPDILLAITTSAEVAVAVTSAASECALSSEGQALEALLPTLERALDEFGARLADVGAIAVCVGPGSFTGLRIGVAFAKSIAQSRAIPIVGVSAYDVAQARQAANDPRVAVVAGKPGYYYVRFVRAAGDPPQFAHGETAEADAVLSRAGVAPPNAVAYLFDGSPRERALWVARIGRRSMGAGARGGWESLAIDYGQRPSAVVKWEASGDRKGGRASAASKSPRQ